MANDVERFYESFASKFVEDYVEGNERVERQLAFFRSAIPRNARSVLILGCGSGETAFYIATAVAPTAGVTAVDLSSTALKIAEAIFAHERITYRKLDITTQALDGLWDYIILPDVYEHIPRDKRKSLHLQLHRLLSKHGTLLMTVPSPAKQASLYASGKGLQIVDEVVSLEDLVEVSRDIQGTVTYFNTISVWETHDYIHAIVERDADCVKPITETDKTPIAGWPHRGLARRVGDALLYRCRLNILRAFWRRRGIQQRLRRHR